MQPQFARSDYWSPDRLGPERVRGCYAFRTLHEAGVPLAGSTDCPVEPLAALAAIGQMVHRPEWSPREALPLETVLRIFSGAWSELAQQSGKDFAPVGYAWLARTVVTAGLAAQGRQHVAITQIRIQFVIEHHRLRREQSA